MLVYDNVMVKHEYIEKNLLVQEIIMKVEVTKTELKFTPEATLVGGNVTGQN